MDCLPKAHPRGSLLVLLATAGSVCWWIPAIARGTCQAHERWNGGRGGRLELVRRTFEHSSIHGVSSWDMLGFIPQVLLGTSRS